MSYEERLDCQIREMEQTMTAEEFQRRNNPNWYWRGADVGEVGTMRIEHIVVTQGAAAATRQIALPDLVSRRVQRLQHGHTDACWAAQKRILLRVYADAAADQQAKVSTVPARGEDSSRPVLHRALMCRFLGAGVRAGNVLAQDAGLIFNCTTCRPRMTLSYRIDLESVEVADGPCRNTLRWVLTSTGYFHVSMTEQLQQQLQEQQQQQQQQKSQEQQQEETDSSVGTSTDLKASEGQQTDEEMKTEEEQEADSDNESESDAEAQGGVKLETE